MHHLQGVEITSDLGWGADHLEGPVKAQIHSETVTLHHNPKNDPKLDAVHHFEEITSHLG